MFPGRQLSRNWICVKLFSWYEIHVAVFNKRGSVCFNQCEEYECLHAYVYIYICIYVCIYALEQIFMYIYCVENKYVFLVVSIFILQMWTHNSVKTLELYWEFSFIVWVGLVMIIIKINYVFDA